MGQRAVYNTDRPEAHDILRRWRTIADGYEPERLLIGETNVEQLPTLMEFYGNGRDELHGGFNFVFINAPFEAGAPAYGGRGHRGPAPRRGLAHLDGVQPRRVAAGHALGRRRPGQGQGRPADPPHPAGDALPVPGGRDRPGRRAHRARTTCSTPSAPASGPTTRDATPSARRCPGAAAPGAGSPSPGSAPGCPWPTRRQCNVADQEGDPDSVLELCRRAVAARHRSDDLAVGSYRSLQSPEGTWAYARGEGATVLLNMGGETAEFDGVTRDGGREHRPRPRGIERRGRADAPALERRRRDAVTPSGR